MKEIILLSLEVVVAGVCGIVGVITLLGSAKTFLAKRHRYIEYAGEPVWTIYGVLLTLASIFMFTR